MGRPRIIAIGDSLSAQPYIIAGEDSYVRPLDCMLWPYGWSAVPAGVGGRKFGDWNDARLQEAAAGYDKAIVLLGTNEAIAGDTLASIRVQAQRVYTTLGAMGVEVWPVTVPPCGLVSDTIRAAHNADLRTGYYTTLAPTYRLIDADEILTDGAGPPAALDPFFDTGDGVHWRTYGGIEVARVIPYRLLMASRWGHL